MESFPSLVPSVEIAVQDPAGARIAFAHGADRIELCQALSVGGLTPSVGTFEATAEALGGGARIAVLVRPRGGGFVYDADEVDVTERDIRAFASRGAGGVVIGALTAAGGIDREAIARWRDAAGDAQVVFHRAIDVLPDPDAVVAELADLGISRILTSGGAARSIDGAAVLADMVARAAGRIEIQAGGGVRIEDIPALRATGIAAVHLSARATSADTAPSGPGGGAPGFDVTDPALVAAAVAAARA